MLELFRSRRRALLWLVDQALLGAIIFVVTGAIFGWNRIARTDHFLDATTIGLVAQVSLYYHGLYGRITEQGFSSLSWRIIRALLIAGVLVWLVLPWTLRDAQDRPWMLLATFTLAALVLPPVRMMLDEWWLLGRFRPPLLILGSGPLAMQCADAAIEKETCVHYVGRLVPEEEAFLFYDKPDIIGTFVQLRQIVNEHDIRHILVCQAERRGKLPVHDLLELKFRGVKVEEGADFIEQTSGKITASEIRPSQMIFADGYCLTRKTRILKRLLDVVGASLGLVLASPFLLLAALAIKLTSRGPVIYSQERVGAYGKPFSMHKFRSMRVDAEANGTAVFAAENDPRVTRVGKFLRQTRLDELPQLWNVLVGEMSLVGPRPERPVFVEQFEEQIPYFRQRLFVKPGVTGHAQVRCRYSAALEDHQEKLEHDLYYIKNVSIFFDLSILIDTVKVVLLRIGSR